VIERLSNPALDPAVSVVPVVPVVEPLVLVLVPVLPWWQWWWLASVLSWLPVAWASWRQPLLVWPSRWLFRQQCPRPTR
jgi:hypothetical protein